MQFQKRLNDLDQDSKIEAVQILADVDKNTAIVSLKHTDWNVALSLRSIERYKQRRRYCVMGLLAIISIIALLVIFIVDLLPDYQDSVISTRQRFDRSTKYPQSPPVVILFVYGHKEFSPEVTELTLRSKNDTDGIYVYDVYCGRDCDVYNQGKGDRCEDCYTASDDSLICTDGRSINFDDEDFAWDFCGGSVAYCPNTYPYMVDKSKLILPTHATCTTAEYADLKSNGGRTECADRSQSAEYGANCSDSNSTNVQRWDHNVATWDYVIIPPEDWYITSVEDLYSIQLRANFSHAVTPNMEDLWADVTWDAAITIAELEDLQNAGFLRDDVDWTMTNLYEEITFSSFKMGVKHLLIPQGSNVKISMTPTIGKPHFGETFTDRTYDVFARQNVYMPYMTQIDITLDSDTIFVAESFEIKVTIWELLSQLGGLMSIMSALGNVVLTLLLMGIWIPTCCCFGEDRKIFGYETIPFDFTFRKQMGAFFDVFGASRKNPLVREERLSQLDFDMNMLNVARSIDDHGYAGGPSPLEFGSNIPKN